MSIKSEHIVRAPISSQKGPFERVFLHIFASKKCGATAFSTGCATFCPGAELPYHTHDCSEAITILEGVARVFVEGRAYLLSPLDCIHVPADIPHSVRNPDATREMIAHTAFGSSEPARRYVSPDFTVEDRRFGESAPEDPETIVRIANCATYELAEGAIFCDLFARRFGSVGICGGYGRFQSGSSLPCHIHEYDESITIVGGEAVGLVQGKEYRLSGLDTAFIPKHRPHRFLNNSDREMAMLWVYAGDEPDRVLVDAGYCSGALSWPGPEIHRGAR